jgi:MinD-like ATPase involved in chromosome partitioning or flagellar assembly
MNCTSLPEVAEEKPVKDRGQILAFTSSKGGVGKTHLAVSLSTSMAKRDARVLLIDADLGNGIVSDRLGFYPKFNLAHFFYLIAGERGNFALANLNYVQKMKFLRSFMAVSRHFDYVVLDMASGINRQTIDFALLAERPIVVASPNDLASGYGSVKACFHRFMQLEVSLYRRIKGYKARRYFRPHILVNNITEFYQGQAAFEALEGAVENRLKGAAGPFEITMSYLGAVFYDPGLFRKSERCPGSRPTPPRPTALTQ